MPPSSCQVVNHPKPEPEPSLPSPLPTLQPVNSQESIDLGDVPGGNKQANVRINNLDAIHMSRHGTANVHYFFDNTMPGNKVFCGECM